MEILCHRPKKRTKKEVKANRGRSATPGLGEDEATRGMGGIVTADLYYSDLVMHGRVEARGSWYGIYGVTIQIGIRW